VMLPSPMLSVVARLTPVSASSESRITVGPVPVCTTARSASVPVAKSGNDHASSAWPPVPDEPEHAHG
jgi:hypothetical protein